MFHEFALDPEVLKTWPAFRYLTDQFGMSHGRLISRFPNKWKKAVYEACESASPIDKSRIEEGLRRIDPKLYASGREYDSACQWIVNASRSHAEHPFRAIITTAERSGANGATDHESISDNTECWLPGLAPVRRQAAEMAAAAEKLLKSSAEIIFVDQHFSCAARHGRPLAAFLEVALQGAVIKRLEYHVGCNNKSADWFREALGRQVKHLNLPAGIPLTFYRWNEKPGGEEFHARYILTELGGLRFDVGLDDADDDRSLQTTDVTAVDLETHCQRRSEYHAGSDSFALADVWIVQDGVVTQKQP